METTEEMEARLFAITGVGAGLLDGLFADQVSPAERRQLAEEAYRQMARGKGFRLRNPSATDSPE